MLRLNCLIRSLLAISCFAHCGKGFAYIGQTTQSTRLLRRPNFVKLLLMLILTVPVANGVTYYVDLAGGNDSNPGTSPAQAWRTNAKVNAAKLSPGDEVLFHRGQIWREQLSISGNGALPNYHAIFHVTSFRSFLSSLRRTKAPQSRLPFTSFFRYLVNSYQSSAHHQPDIQTHPPPHTTHQDINYVCPDVPPKLPP